MSFNLVFEGIEVNHTFSLLFSFLFFFFFFFFFCCCCLFILQFCKKNNISIYSYFPFLIVSCGILLLYFYIVCIHKESFKLHFKTKKKKTGPI